MNEHKLAVVEYMFSAESNGTENDVQLKILHPVIKIQ